MERVISVARKEAEAKERRSVAAEVDRLVRESGLSRSGFAFQIGTSASRLSTYATGKVTPSAALMLRLPLAFHRKGRASAPRARANLTPSTGLILSPLGLWS